MENEFCDFFTPFDVSNSLVCSNIEYNKGETISFIKTVGLFIYFLCLVKGKEDLIKHCLQTIELLLRTYFY
jgi:hypothetical protein